MKIKIVLFSFCFFLAIGVGFSQKKKAPKSIISQEVAIKKYHNKEDLDQMQKGELITLYSERIDVLIKILPYLAFATKPGITMSTLGIPNNNNNRKALDSQFESTNNFIENSVEFQKEYLPYSDTNKLVFAILFYEEIMKSLHEYSEYH